jgi:CelD/BcsL family acetyltransferase involved in cellulose biosynthesis
MSSYSAELVTTVEAFEALKDRWNDLVANMEHPEIFYAWEWNFHYLKCYRDDAHPMIIVVNHSSGAIAGIAPLCLRRVRRFMFTVRVVETIVTEIGDYSNVLVHGGFHRGQVVAAIFACLQQHANSWDVFDVSQLCSRDPTTFHVINVAQAFADWSVRVQILTPVAVRTMRSPQSAENHRQLRQIRNRRKTLLKNGFVLHIGCQGPDFDVWWPAFLSMHRHAWRTSPLNTETGRTFFSNLVHSPGMKGKIELSVMELNGQPVAMHFGFVGGKKIYFYMPSMDKAFRRERVGAVLLSAMVDHYSKTYEAFDFLRGMEDYKVWYTDRLDANIRIVVYRTASAPAFFYNIKETARRFAVDLGLPKVIAQTGRRLIDKLRIEV